MAVKKADGGDAVKRPARVCTECGELFWMVQSARHHQHETDHDEAEIQRIEVTVQ